jgi:hypothetical protein
MVRVDTSQPDVEPPIAFGSVGVKTALHETLLLAVTSTVVLLEANGALVSVQVPSTVPVQLLLSYNVNSTLPLAAAPLPVVIVAVSFGRQVWAVVVLDVSFTLKHSVVEFVPLVPA